MMIIDIPNERGMSDADIEYGSNKQCHFPLFDFLKPLPVEYMVLVYFVMFLGTNFIISYLIF
jgi:vitamin K-dependent gamma-carboxylase